MKVFSIRPRTKLSCIFLVLLLISIGYIGQLIIRYIKELLAMGKCPLPPNKKLKSGTHIDNSLDLWSRADVQTCTYWKAPILWEGMFDAEVYDAYHKEKGTSVALTVFAVGRYLEMYLLDFLTSAEKHFMTGLPVTYYVFTDTPEWVPAIEVASGRTMEVIAIERHKRWQDISMSRMETIADIIESHIRHRNQYVFCFDVDQIFVNRFGSEVLGDTVALLHAFFYRSRQEEYSYDRNPKSVAYMETGDFYYHAAIFGGTCEGVKNITRSCYQGIAKDKENQVEALWHDESHLNKYFWLHKPSKILSPEYCWSTIIGYRWDIHVHRLLWAEKHYDILRTGKKTEQVKEV